MHSRAGRLLRRIRWMVSPRRRAVLWRDADRSLQADLQMVLEAVLVLDGVACDVAGEEEPRQLEVFLFGAGPGFSPRRGD